MIWLFNKHFLLSFIQLLHLFLVTLSAGYMGSFLVFESLTLSKMLIHLASESLRPNHLLNNMCLETHTKVGIFFCLFS